jgi:PAB-dependent poly(A)-specific ribonuclease subunit 3
VSAPAFVPAAVAAAQRASLSAWGGVTPGSGKSVTVTSPATFTTTSSVSTSSIRNDILSVSSGQTSVVDTQTTSVLAALVQEIEVSVNPDPVSSGISGSTSLSSTFSNSLLNAQPFIPSNSSANSGSSNGPTPPHSGTTQGASIGSANATPFVPSGGSGGLVASAVSAAPFVPRSRLHLTGAITGGGVSSSMGRTLQPSSQSLMVLGGSAPQQQLQMRQQLSQLQQQMQHEAAALAQAQAQAQAQAHMLAAAARMSNNQYMGMEVPMVIPSFRLPDGDDPALGMTAMSPPNPAFLARYISVYALLWHSFCGISVCSY